MTKITQKLLHHLFYYNKQTGILYWKNKSSKYGKSHIGEVAGCKNEYINIVINRKQYKAHRLIWLREYGTLPSGEIDHIDHDRYNNRLDNLRDVSSSDNARNRKLRADNTSGQVGVNEHRGYYDARIMAFGKRVHLGSFKKIEDAISARKEAEIKYGYHSNHGI